MAPSNDKPLRQLAAEKLHGNGGNPSQLGDPVSLKAETANSTPTDQDRGAASEPSRNTTTARVPESSGGSHEEKMLKYGRPVRGMTTHHGIKEQKGDDNKTMIGDPTSLKAETSGGGGRQGDNGPSQDKPRKDGSKL